MSRLQEKYQNELAGELQKKLGLKNPMEVPKITKITLNMGVGEAVGDKKVMEFAVGDMEKIAALSPSAVRGLELFVGEDGMNVRLGRGQHRQKLRRFRQVLERLAREKTRPSYVYLDNVRSPERVTVRLP
mgnify:CR=1 FL=1